MTESELEEKLLTKGFITAVDAPELDKEESGQALREKLDTSMRDDDKEPYLVYELFDFQKGIIKGILFNMDIIPSRQAAMDKLSEVSHNPEIKLTEEAEEEIKTIGK